MSQIRSPSLGRCYAMVRVARVWKISRASVYRSRKEMPPNTSGRRPGPGGACSDAELAEHIRQHIAASRLHGEGYRKLWARLRFAGDGTAKIVPIRGGGGGVALGRGVAMKSRTTVSPREAWTGPLAAESCDAMPWDSARPCHPPVAIHVGLLGRSASPVQSQAHWTDIHTHSFSLWA